MCREHRITTERIIPQRAKEKERKETRQLFSTKGQLHLICSRLKLTANQDNCWSVEQKYLLVVNDTFCTGQVMKAHPEPSSLKYIHQVASLSHSKTAWSCHPLLTPPVLLLCTTTDWAMWKENSWHFILKAFKSKLHSLCLLCVHYKPSAQQFIYCGPFCEASFSIYFNYLTLYGLI